MQVELVVAAVREFEVRLDALVALILKEVGKGTFTSLDAEGVPLEAGAPRPGRILKDEEGE